MECSTFEEFYYEYEKLMKCLILYDAEQAGCLLYAEKLGWLVDNLPPEWEDMADEILRGKHA